MFKNLLAGILIIWSTVALAAPPNTTTVPTTLQNSPCTATQLYFGSGSGGKPNCLNLGTNLSITSGTLNATGGGGGGGVSSFAFTNGSGFSGTVTNSTTTPTLALTTSTSGIIKGSAGSLIAAISGTDYQAPLTITTSGTSGPATLIGTILNIPQYTGGGGGTAFKQNFIAGTNFTPGSTTTLTLTTTPSAGTAVLVFFDGVEQTGGAGTTGDTWTLSTNVITFSAPITAIHVVQVVGLSSSGGGGAGTVTSFAFTNANGFSGSVSNSTTTPTLTVATSVTGVLKGNGTAISAATAGTDYQAPITLTTTGTTGAATFAANVLNVPNYASAGGNSSIYTNAVTTCGADPTGVSDSSAIIQTCISTYGAVAFPTGTYKACNVVIDNSQAVVKGTGSLRSANLPVPSAPGGTVFICDSTTQSIFVLKNSSPAYNSVTTYITVTMQGFSCIKSSGVTPTAGACIDNFDTSTRCTQCIFRDLYATNQFNGFNMAPTTYSWFDNVTAFNNYNDGFLFKSLAASNSNISWSGTGLSAAQNNGYGVHLENTVGTFLTVGTWTNSITFANALGGLYAHASGSGNSINDLFLVNWTSSNDNNDGVKWDTNGGSGLTLNGGILEQCGFGNLGGVGRNIGQAVSNNGNCINIAGSAGTISVNGMNISTAASNGIGTASPGPAYLNISNNIFYDNASVASTCGGNCNSITVGGSATITTISGNITLNNIGGAGAHQAYALFTSSGATTTITGNYFQAALSGTCFGVTNGVGNIGTSCNAGGGTGSVTSVTCFGTAITTTGTCVTTGQMPGDATGASASTGNVGEYISATVLSGSAVSATSGTPSSITNVSIGAGDWDCRGDVQWTASGGAQASVAAGWVGTSAGALPTGNTSYYLSLGVTYAANSIGAFSLAPMRFVSSGSQTVFLGYQFNFASGSLSTYGSMGCRRMR